MAQNSFGLLPRTRINPLVRWGGLLAVIVIAGAVATTWMVVARTQGKETLKQTARLRNDQITDMTKSLTRSGHAGKEDAVDVILATDVFFRKTNRPQDAASYGANDSIVFVANESVHYGSLDKQFAPILRVDGDRMYVPSETRVINDSEHHRTTALIYKDAPQSLLMDTHTVEMLLPGATSDNRETLTWYSPLEYSDSVQETSVLSLGLLVSLGAGLLAAISPCLLQLTAFYLPTLAGVSMDAAATGASPRAQRGRVMLTAGWFVLGFTIPYTLGGALIGSIGQALSASGVLSPTGPVVVGAGFVMIVMAVLVAYRARAPIVCHMPMPAGLQKSGKLPLVTTFVSGFAIATGCLACFGGAILGVLLVYTGLFGSALLGGVSMLVFSLGLAIPFLIAAFSLSWVMPIAQRLQKWTPVIGLVSAALMLFFGITMITGNYHVVSGFLFKTLSLG